MQVTAISGTAGLKTLQKVVRNKKVKFFKWRTYGKCLICISPRIPPYVPHLKRFWLFESLKIK